MALYTLVARVLGTVGLLVVVTGALVVDGSRLRAGVRSLPDRLRTVAPSILGLVAVLGISSLLRRASEDLSWAVGVNITGLIFALEGTFVASVQSLATPVLTAYFAAVYVVGYAFLLVFPPLAYLLLDDRRPFQRTMAAYAANYGIGVVCYVLFIAYGPRNLMPDLVEPLLYTRYPQTHLLTSEVNTNTNVFPSLHTSLSVTVATLAVLTRDRYPRWPLVAVPLAASVVVSTMYLSIHWATDVVAGALLGVGCVALTCRLLPGRKPFEN